MRKYFIYILLLVLVSIIFFLVIISYKTTPFHTVTLQERISISVPQYLSKTDSIDPAAILQLENKKEQLFLLVYEITDTANSPVAIIFKNISDTFISNIGYAALIKYYPKEINAHHAVIGNIRGEVNETGVYYRIAIIEASNKLYYKIILGVTKQRLPDFDEDFDRILNSITLF